MNPLDMLLCGLCVLGIAGGQILMKCASVAWNETQSLCNIRVGAWIASALLIYSMASIGWIYLLRQLPLSSAYPFLSLTYIFVPLAGVLIFNERLNWTDAMAAGLIIVGIIVGS